MSAAPHPSQERAGRIGASDAAAILGFSRWRTPLQVKRRILGIDDDNAGDAAYWGSRIEPLLGERFAAETGKRLRRDNRTLRHPRHDFITGHIDYRILSEKALLECKTASAFLAKDWADGVPAYYLVQGYVYLALTGWERCYFALLLGGQQYKEFEVPADTAIQDAIIEKLADWWQRYIVEDNDPPPVNLDDINQLYKGGGAQIEANAEIASDISELHDIADEQRTLRDRQSELQLRVKRHMADHDILTSNGRPAATWTTQERRTIDAERLRADHPELFPEYLKTSTTRVFRVK